MKWSISSDQSNEIPTLSDLVSEYFTPTKQPKKKKWWQFWRKAEPQVEQGPKSKFECHMWLCMHHDRWVLCKTPGTWGCKRSHSCLLSPETYGPIATDYFLVIDDKTSKVMWHDGTEISAADPEFFAKIEALLEAAFNEMER